MFWLSRLCRICGQIGEMSHPIFQGEATNKDIEMKIKKCLNVNVSSAKRTQAGIWLYGSQVYRDDYKPKEICSGCLTKLNEFYDFLIVCHGANEKFDSMLYEYEDANRKWQGMTYSPQKNGVIVPSKGDSEGLNDCSDIIMMVQYKDNNLLPLENLEPLNEQEIYQQSQTVLRHSGDLNGESNYCNGQMQRNYFYPQQNSQNDYGACVEIFDAPSCDYANAIPDSAKKKTNKILVSVESLRESVKVNSTEKLTRNKPKCVRKRKTLKLFSCTSCDKKFSKRSLLSSHISTHTNVRPYVCHICSKSFVVRWDLTSHQKIHSNIHKCRFCPKTFSVQSKLQRHERIHTNERPFVCKCGKRFSDKRNLIGHERTHSELRGFTCDVCQKSYKTKSHLNDHRRAHSVEVLFKCFLCTAEYKWKKNLLTHMKKHKGYECSYCKKDCGRMSALLRHQKMCESRKVWCDVIFFVVELKHRAGIFVGNLWNTNASQNP